MKAEFLGRVPYQPTLEKMQQIARSSAPALDSLLWICEHEPVFTLGLASRKEHLLMPGHIPVVQTDRGGQVTYHGPGQVVAYPIFDLKRAGYYVKEYVYRLEEAAIRTLMHFGVTGHRVKGAPGIYVRKDDPSSHAALRVNASDLSARPEVSKGTGASMPQPERIAKIAALGIKVTGHRAYHGLALNVAMDLQPFSRIDPCGYPGLETTDLSTIGVDASFDEAAQVLAKQLIARLAS